MEPTQTQLNARDYIRPLLTHKWLIVVIVAVVTTATYLYYKNQPPVYTTSTSIFLKPSTATSALGATGVGIDDRELANQARLLQTTEVAARVARDIGFRGDPAILLGSLRVAPQSGADFLDIQTTGSDPRLTATLADAFAKAFIENRAATERREAQRALRSAKAELAKLPARQQRGSAAANLVDRIGQLQFIANLPSGSAQQVERAAIPGTPIAPQPRRNAIFAFALSLMFAVLAAYGLDRLDRRIRKVDTVESLYRAPVLVAVPRARNVAPHQNGQVRAAAELQESFRTLRTTLDLTIDSDRHSLVVTSAVPREGKSTVVRNLALAYREVGKRVAVVEADLRRPTLAKIFRVEPEPGVAEVLGRNVPLEEALQSVTTDLPGVDALSATAINGYGYGNGDELPGSVVVLTSGSPAVNPTSLFSTERFRQLIHRLKSEYDVVLIDTPPLLAVGDALQLLSLVDGALLVSRVGETTDESADRATEMISRVPNARVLGVVANAVPAASLGYGHGTIQYQST